MTPLPCAVRTTLLAAALLACAGAMAQQLRQPPVARATPLPPAALLAAETPASRAPASTGTPRATRADARLAPSMLERFGATHHANESTP